MAVLRGRIARLSPPPTSLFCPTPWYYVLGRYTLKISLMSSYFELRHVHLTSWVESGVQLTQIALEHISEDLESKKFAGRGHEISGKLVNLRRPYCLLYSFNPIDMVTVRIVATCSFQVVQILIFSTPTLLLTNQPKNYKLTNSATVTISTVTVLSFWGLCTEMIKLLTCLCSWARSYGPWVDQSTIYKSCIHIACICIILECAHRSLANR